MLNKLLNLFKLNKLLNLFKRKKKPVMISVPFTPPKSQVGGAVVKKITNYGTHSWHSKRPGKSKGL